MTIKERLIQKNKNTPACHSERSEESCALNERITLACHSERSEESHALNGRIINKNRYHCHYSQLAHVPVIIVTAIHCGIKLYNN
jgi:hypothetical protein